ncbi:hypothetical protein [Altererythrobacter sp.]|uniref:hypothetical protein n=1 Tax=Altererythrobacter sp. TaxID=1872480 RepID=UPI003D03E456
MEAPTHFAGIDRRAARLLLLAIAAVLALAALTWQPSPPQLLSVDTQAIPTAQAEARTGNASSPAPQQEGEEAQSATRDVDLALYDAITARVAAGENYYQVAVAEQRARNFPVRPGFAVRLPTLAVTSAALGPLIFIVALLLAALTGFAWWRRLTPILDRPARRVIALGLLGWGAAVGFKPMYFVLHEAWSGMFLALALALHSPGRWRGAWIAAALALAIREHALPFVMLMGALALWRRDWREMAAWSLLVAGFVALLAYHVSLVGQLTGPQDPLSSSWLALRGPGGWIEFIVLCTGLYLLPAWLAAPLVLLPLLGWAGLKDRLGLEALLLFAGYGLLFMIAGRANNFYWGLMVAPAWFVGLYWVPGALRDLWHSARAN